MDKANAKPILFNTEMVQAILEGRKTVTRRIVKPQPVRDFPLGFVTDSTDSRDIGKYGWGQTQRGGIIDYAKPPYKVGDILYVRETWRKNLYGTGWSWDYKASPEYWYMPDNYPWRPSIHMPKEAARVFLKVTDVRVERLQDILCNGMQKEGCIPKTVKGGQWEQWQRDYFKPLWDSTIKKIEMGKYGWEANPWVWVIEFERIDK